MANINIEEVEKKQENPILKKRVLPGDVVATSETVEKKSPLKKRATPLDGPNAEKSVASLMKKRELPTDEKETVSPLKKKVNPFDTQDEQPKEKSSLDKMRERIAAQKKLEQDMMTQQSLRNQEKVSMRNKLSALTKELTESSEEETPKVKPVINSDLKTEALEMQNKKLKSDLEKSKKQLQTVLSLEYQNMRVLDSGSLSLSEEFIQNLNNIKEQYESQQNVKEQALKDEIKVLQKELEEIKIKNETAEQAQAKLVVKAQENDKIKKFKEEIKVLEKQIKEKEKQLEELSKEKEDSFKLIEELNQKVNSLEQQVESNKELSSAFNDLNIKLVEQETRYQLQLKTEIDKSFETIKQLEKQIIDLESKKVESEKISELQTKIESLQTDLTKKSEFENKYNSIVKENNELKSKEQYLEKELENFRNQLSKLQLSIQEEQEEKEKALSSLRKLNLEKAATIEEEIKELNNKLSENNKLKTELAFQYDKFISARNKIASSFAVVRKYDKVIKECEEAKTYAKKVNDEVSLMDPKTDKSAYKAKVAEAKSMNSKAEYLAKQLKKLAKNKNVIEYLKLISSINEYENLFKDIDDMNNEHQSLVDAKIKEVEVLKG